MGKCALTGCLPGPVNVDHEPLRTCPVNETTEGGKRLASEQILVKKRTQGFHCGLIKCGKKAGQSRTMGQLISTKQRHEWPGPRSQPFIKRLQGRLARNCITDQDGDKIDHIVGAKASARETHLLLDGCEHPCMREHMRKCCHFAHPGWYGRRGRRLDLDDDWWRCGIQDTTFLSRARLGCVIRRTPCFHDSLRCVTTSGRDAMGPLQRPPWQMFPSLQQAVWDL